MNKKEKVKKIFQEWADRLKKILFVAIVAVIIVALFIFFISIGSDGHPNNSWSFTDLIINSLLVTGIFYGLLLIIKESGKRNFILTAFRENTVGIVVGAGGGFIKALCQSRTKCLNPQTWEVENREESNTQTMSEKIIDILGLTGIKFLGIPGTHQRPYHTFRFNSLRQTPDDTTKDAGGGIYFTPHDEKINYALLQWDVYYARVEAAEDKRMIPLNIDFIIPARICNPYKAIYGLQEWLEYVWTQIIPALRRVARHKYDWIEQTEVEEDGSLKMAATKADTEDMALFFNKNIEGTKDELKHKGVDIGEATILRIAAAGAQAEKFVELATKVVEAIQEAKKKRVDYKVEVERIAAVYGEIKKQDKEFIIRRLEAMEVTGEKGNMIIAAPDFNQALLGKMVSNTSKKEV